MSLGPTLLSIIFIRITLKKEKEMLLNLQPAFFVEILGTLMKKEGD